MNKLLHKSLYGHMCNYISSKKQCKRVISVLNSKITYSYVHIKLFSTMKIYKYMVTSNNNHEFIVDSEEYIW